MNLPADPEESILQRKVPLIVHLKELKKRLLYSVAAFVIALGICGYFAEDIYQILVSPLAKASSAEGRRLIYTGLTEMFFTYMQLSIYMALALAFPFIAAQCYLFVAPGLYKRERRVFLPYLILSPVLFILGGLMAYYGIFPVAWEFFLSFEKLGGDLPIQLEARVSEYLHLVIVLMVGFGIAFQLPIILTLLAHAGLITHETLIKRRRYAIVLIFIAAAILTPPDVISQIGMALPLLLLYELSILVIKLISRHTSS